MKQIFYTLLFLSSLTALAQQPIDYQTSANKLYWQNKKPFAGYWQQDVHYKIDANILEKKNIIEAQEKLRYTNNSPDTLYFVYFHLYQNAFVKGSYLEELHRVNKQPATNLGRYEKKGLGTEILNLKVDGQTPMIEIDNTIMKVYLNTPIYPNQSATFLIDFKTYFDNSGYRRRMGVTNSYGFPHYNGVHWYPRISVYDMKKGWDTDQHLNKELYGNYGQFDVNLTFADNYVVEATGALLNPETVYANGLREKLDIKNFINKPWNEKPSTITPYDSTKRKTWSYKAINVHDFAFTADPAYRIDEKEWNGVQCIGLVLEPHASKWQNSADYVSKIIKTFSEDFGMYEYPKMVAADANDGMEYPMLTLDGGADPDYRGLLVHEIGHNWFYGMIGNNETYRAALDEGFTQFLTAWGLKKIDGETMVSVPIKNKFIRKHKDPVLVMDRSVYNGYMREAVKGEDPMLNTHSNDFHSAIGHENGYGQVYYKTATMLYNLQYVLGDELFQNAMKHYVAKWKIAHPYFEDFRQSIIEYTHQDLNWFFDQWLETTKSIDYGISSIKKGENKNDYKIKFKRYGQMQMPIDFQVTAKDGKKYNYTIPNTVFQKTTSNKTLSKWYGWDLMYPTYTSNVNIPSGIKMVQIDPSNRLADVNMMNNYKQRGFLIAPKSSLLKVENYVSNPASWKKYNAAIRPDVWWNSIDGMKLGVNFNGHYMNTFRKLYATVWFNSRFLSNEKYAPYEGESWWKNVSPVDYTIRYETPYKKINPKVIAGFESRQIEGFAKHSLFAKYQFSPKSQFKIEATTLYRRSDITNEYLFDKNEWTSYTDTKKNSFLQLTYNTNYNGKAGNGFLKAIVRTSFNYNHSYFQLEDVHRYNWKKFETKTRAFGRFGFGNEIPNESAVYLQGANPEELMENKFTRSQGIIPLSAGGYSSTDFSNLHMGGGMNLRGYTGYYAIDQDGSGNQYLNYKGRSAASLNIEIDFDKYFSFIKPKYIRDYIHFDTYLFADAGIISRGALSPTSISSFIPTNAWSKFRSDAGVGMAMTIKKFGPFETIPPFTVRLDMPFFLNSPPYAKPDFIQLNRWVIGVGRSF